VDYQPKWLRAIQNDDDLKASFNVWVDEAIKVYAERALFATTTMDQLLGLKFAAGELKAIQGMVNYKDEEIIRQNTHVTEGYLRA